MNGLEDVSDEVERMWQYIKENKRIIGLPVSTTSGLDILNVLRDVYETIDKDPKGAKKMLTLVATVMLSVASGESENLINEIQVSSAMEQFDDSIKGILDEESR